jgi:hypothetical protein
MTLDELFKHLATKDWEEHGFRWPPDAFALCGTALWKSGCYTNTVSRWPPKIGKKADPRIWVEKITNLGWEWRAASPKNKTPAEIKAWWKILIQQKKTPWHTLAAKKHADLVEILIQLCAAADEASAGIGLSDNPDDDFEAELPAIYFKQLNDFGTISTVCKIINQHHVRVLPKLHTPTSGITIRSLSHHLALCQSGEVVPQYWPAPNAIGVDDAMNILIVPWPRTIIPSKFSACKRQAGPLFNMSEDFGFFRYEIPEQKNIEKAFKKIVKSAERTTGKVHGIIFPEMALNPKTITSLWRHLKQRKKPCFLISGTSQKAKQGILDENKAVCHVPMDQNMRFDLKLEQAKHHRWRLDKSQLQQYSLTGQLSDKKQWWEASTIPPRTLQFVKLNPYAVMTFLICEDLARQDPIADLVRAVGPNLVFALLMDGPQLASRWSSRYATVLADDPGCSVLTLTSIGMARMSKCLGKPESRIIALWKDSKKGPFEIELPFDAEAMVLSLKLHRDSEWAADGRCAKESAGRWELETVHPIRHEHA